MLGHGAREDAEALRGEVADVLAPMGLRLSPAKAKVIHMERRVRFPLLPRLGFRVQWKRKRGTGKWYGLHLHRRPARPVGDEGQDPP